LRRNWLLKRAIQGKVDERVEVVGTRGRRRKQILDDLKEERGCWKLKEGTLYRNMWRACFGRGYGPVAGKTE